MSQQKKYSKDDPNRPETEEDGYRAEQLRRLKVRHRFKEALARMQKSSESTDKNEHS